MIFPNAICDHPKELEHLLNGGFTFFDPFSFISGHFKISFERKTVFDSGKEVVFLYVNMYDMEKSNKFPFKIFEAIVLDRRRIFSQKAQTLIFDTINELIRIHSNLKERFEKMGFTYFSIKEKGYDVMKAQNDEYSFIASKKEGVLEDYLKENPPYGNSRVIFFPFVFATRLNENITKCFHEKYGFDLFSYVLDFHKYILNDGPKVLKVDFTSLNPNLRDEILMFEGRKLIEKNGLFQYHRRVWDRYFQRNAWI